MMKTVPDEEGLAETVADTPASEESLHNLKFLFLANHFWR